MIAGSIYLLCAVTSLIAAALLLRRWRQPDSSPLLFWSTLAFSVLALNNTLLWLDLAVLSSVDLSLPRTAAGTIAMAIMLYGLIRHSTS